ncbi:DNA translocase FtsK [Lysinibacillus sp. NPDC093210]|uniref:DNA translocase FtsK n=1 Tax=Lysinibacillus sp. NPDC093210 TaxID=3364133 RepID=UPI0037F63899
MNWFKKKIEKILNRDEYEYDEYYEEYEEQPDHQQPLNETSVTRQKTFRFPLIDDEEDMPQASQSRDVFDQMDDSYGQIEDLTLPKHLNHKMADSRVYDIEVSGIRELLENRSKRTGRTTTTRSQPKQQEYPTKASMVFRDAQVEAKPVQKEPIVKQESKVEDILPQNRKRFVPTDVPSPVYGFAKPSPIEQLLNKRKEEQEAEMPSVAKFAKEATTNKPIENILEEKEPIKSSIDVRELLEIPRSIEVPSKQPRATEEVEATEQSQLTNEVNTEEPSKKLITFEEVEATEQSQPTDEVNTEEPSKQPITFEEVVADEQNQIPYDDNLELPVPQTTSFAVNFEDQIKEAVQQELAVEQLSADQSEIHVKEVVVEQLQIENSTIHIGEVTVVQPTNEDVNQEIVDESSVKQEKSRIPFNVLMLKTDKEKWRISQQLKAISKTTTEEKQTESAFTRDNYEAVALSEDKPTPSPIVEVEQSNQEPSPGEVDTKNISVITMSPVATMTHLPTIENIAVEAEALEEIAATTFVDNVLPQAESTVIEAEALEEIATTTFVDNVLSQAESTVIEAESMKEESAPMLFVEKVLPQEETSVIEDGTREIKPAIMIEDNALPQAENPIIEAELFDENTAQAFGNNDLPLDEQTEETIAIQSIEVPEKVEGNLSDVLVISDVEAKENEVIPPKPIHVYQKPTDEFLEPPEEKTQDTEWMEQQGDTLVEALSYFQVSAQIESIMQGPAVTQFEITVSHGTKVSKIRNLADDLKLALAAKDIRIQAPIPGKSSIGIEIPNRVSRAVRLSEVTNSASFLDSDSPLEAALGLDLTGKPVTIDLRKMPHGLIAGATGSGKSVCINSILVSLLYKAAPHELKLMLIDPKMVELAPFNHIPHLVSPVITDVKAATAALKWAVEEMERRYQLFAHAGARDITRYNALADKNNEHSLKLPYILIVIDELADLMMMSPADVEEAICRIAQKARACGIHLIVATQRPSVDVITGLIKSNIPTRIAFAVSSQIDSRTILDGQGAERLLGRGDMLYLGNGMSAPVRLQGTFVTDDEIESIIDHVREQGEPDYIFDQEELLKKSEVSAEQDDLFEDVCRFVYEQGGASTSLIQRKYHIGYNRAARLIDMLESHGFVSEARGSKPRESYITEQDLIAMFE